MENPNNLNDSIHDRATRRKARLERLEELSKLTGLPAGNYRAQNKPEPLPVPGTNWELWAHMPKATLPEAVALSLGIDPSAIEPRSGCAGPGKKFDDRLKLACAHVSEAGPLRPIKELGRLFVWGKPEQATVSLSEFAQWALSMGWELPERFPRFKAAPRQPATTSTAQATQNPLHVAIQQIVKSELQKHKPAPVMPTEPQATTPSPAPAPFVELVAQRGYVLALPSGQTHVQFGELAHLIADALWPEAGADDTRMSYGLSRASLDGELVQAVKAGTLQVKDPLTFGPHTFPVGNALLSALVTVDDLREFVAGRGLKVESVQTHTTPSPTPVAAAGASGGVELVTGKRWTPEKLAELKSYREKHGTKKAAEHFCISESLIRQKLPSDRPQPKGYSAFTHLMK